jgi:post-segregation antitoxin (ccd killing protein)
MAARPTKTVEVDAELLERARRVADERGIAVPQLVQDALEHELAKAAPNYGQPWQGEDEGEQPPLTCIGAFSSGRGDLSELASEDVFEPEPSR